MEPKDLAWNGTTIEEKRQLLAHLMQERDRLIREEKAKDGHLGLASGCVDMIGTANAAIKDADARIDADDRREWEKFRQEVLGIAREAVAVVVNEDKGDWSPSDFEVAGAIEIQTSNGDLDRIGAGIVLLKEGLVCARKQGSLGSIALLHGQLVRAGIAGGYLTVIEKNLRDLHDAIFAYRDEPGEEDPKIMTRAYRALAEGGKFLAIEFAQAAESPNQELKARHI